MASSSQCLFQSGRDKRQTDSEQRVSGRLWSCFFGVFFLVTDADAAFVAAEKALMRTNDNGCDGGAAWRTGQRPSSINSDRDA